LAFFDALGLGGFTEKLDRDPGERDEIVAFNMDFEMCK